MQKIEQELQAGKAQLEAQLKQMRAEQEEGLQRDMKALSSSRMLEMVNEVNQLRTKLQQQLDAEVKQSR